MATQDRAIRTRQAILTAAAAVFAERGYQATTITEVLSVAGVTKGALYFHFQSKEDLALEILGQQDQGLVVPDRACKVQQLVDIWMLHAHRLRSDPMVRASVALSTDQLAHGLDRSGPFRSWNEMATTLFEKARTQGELLPHVVPAVSAGVFVGSFAGIQSMSHALAHYTDLGERTSELLCHLLPSVVVPSVLASVDFSPGRGETVYREVQDLRQDD